MKALLKNGSSLESVISLEKFWCKANYICSPAILLRDEKELL